MALKHRLRGAMGTVQNAGSTFTDPAGVTHMHPWTPTNVQPPPGSYDPALDASLGRAQRGYGDLQSDYNPVGGKGAPGRLAQRAQDDLNLAVQGVTGESGTYTRSLSDLLRSRARESQDFATQQAGVNRTADRQVADTGRSFANLAANQADQQNATGNLEGGGALEAASKRAANEGLADSRINENRTLALAGLQTTHDRYGADSGTNETRLGQNKDTELGRLGLGYQRFTDDAAQKLARAGRELGFFGQDTTASKVSQAKANGWVAPGRPAGEGVDAKGPFRTVSRNGRTVLVRPDGTVEPMPATGAVTPGGLTRWGRGNPAAV